MNHTNAGTVSTAPSLSLRLREATSEQHARAEKHPIQQALVRGAAEPALYAAWLRDMAALHERFEARLAAARTNEALAGVIEDHHFRLDLIGEDLKALAAIDGSIAQSKNHACCCGHAGCGAGAGSSAVSGANALRPRTLAAWNEIDSMIERDASAVLGPFYVLEGSTNGGRFIAMAIRKSLPLPAGAGTRYLDPHGEKIRERWATTKAAMDAVPLSPAQHDAIVDAAKRTFDAVTLLMDELVASRSA
ncbi:MAG: biliverdin-producing heme oxygenase [Phycisphaerae bacterium]|nr:biliverdin-producing heme oxygenase [Phycisphaerae bacterium]